MDDIDVYDRFIIPSFLLFSISYATRRKTENETKKQTEKQK